MSAAAPLGVSRVAARPHASPEPCGCGAERGSATRLETAPPEFGVATATPSPIVNPMRIQPASIACAALFLSAVALNAQNPLPFQNPDAPMEARITDLLSRMTLGEKIDCLGTRPDVPRLGVKGSPHIEGYHGVAQGGPSNWGQRNPTPTTQFPQAYGLGATWDPELIRKVAEEESIEARFLFQSPKYNRAGLVVRAPNADLARDPRWGRTEESYGEDAFHVGTLAAAFVRGLQGTDARYLRTASLTKHFLANSREDLRESSSSNFDERLVARILRETVRDGGRRRRPGDDGRVQCGQRHTGARSPATA